MIHGHIPGCLPASDSRTSGSRQPTIPAGEPYSMRRIALLSLTLALSGCGYNTWWNPPFTGGRSPNVPVLDSENMRRVTGASVAVAPLSPEAGDIWPGPLPPATTLQDLEHSGNLQMPGDQPGPAASRQPRLAPYPAAGSSTPPGSAQSSFTPMRPASPASGPYAPAAAPPDRGGTGQMYQTNQGPAISSGGTSAYQSVTTPGGGTAIVVPNGNGTSTVIHPNGRIETVPTPQ